MEYIHCFEYSLVALGLVAVCCHFMQVLKFLDNAFANTDSHGIPYTSKSFQLPDKVMILGGCQLKTISFMRTTQTSHCMSLSQQVSIYQTISPRQEEVRPWHGLFFTATSPFVCPWSRESKHGSHWDVAVRECMTRLEPFLGQPLFSDLGFITKALHWDIPFWNIYDLLGLFLLFLGPVVSNSTKSSFSPLWRPCLDFGPSAEKALLKKTSTECRIP